MSMFMPPEPCMKTPDDAEDYFDILFHKGGIFDREIAGRTDKLEMTIMAHGGGTQTSVLLLLAARSARKLIKRNQEGFLHLDFAMFSNVGDHGTEAEWPSTIDYLQKLTWYCCDKVPVLKVDPWVWNPWLKEDSSGLFDRYMRRENMPLRQYRSCTDWFKVQPQVRVLHYLRDNFAERGVELKFRQVIGYSADEKHRAKRFDPEVEWIRPYFPLIEWGWKRDDTMEKARKMLALEFFVLGEPQKSGCWFCPFQRRGRYDPVTLEPEPRTWLALRDEQPQLFEKAKEMENAVNNRRTGEGKKPIYFYGKKPLDHWMAPGKNAVTMALFDLDEFQEGDDQCSTDYACFR